MMKKKEPIVFLSGWGVEASVWFDFSRHFTPVDCLCIDLPGYGRHRELPHANTIHQMLDQLLPLLPKKAHYIGWSLGGLISLALKQHYPSAVTAITAIASAPCLLNTADSRGLMISQLSQLKKNITQHKTRALRHFALWCCGHNRQVYQQLAPHLAYSASEKTLLNGLELLASCNLMEKFKHNDASIQTILGGQDPIIPPPDGTPTQQQCIIAAAHHIPFLSHPDEVLRYVN